MPAFTLRGATLILISVLVLAAIYGGFTWISTRARCISQDTYICSMRAHLKARGFERMQGTYKSSEGNVVSWRLDADLYEFTYYTGKDATMHIIGTPDTVYVYDYTDDRWWKQKAERMRQYDVQLPFEPQVYMRRMSDILLNEETEYIYREAKICGGTMCRYYKIHNANYSPLSILLSIEEKSNKLKGLKVTNGELVENIFFKTDDSPAITIPTKNIKIASSNQNIFLDVVFRPRKNENAVPNYIELFEKERLEAEQLGKTSNSPRYITPTPTKPL